MLRTGRSNINDMTWWRGYCAFLSAGWIFWM